MATDMHSLCLFKLVETVSISSISHIYYLKVSVLAGMRLMHAQHTDIDSPHTAILYYNTRDRICTHTHVYMPICMQISSNTAKPRLLACKWLSCLDDYSKCSLPLCTDHQQWRWEFLVLSTILWYPIDRRVWSIVTSVYVRGGWAFNQMPEWTRKLRVWLWLWCTLKGCKRFWRLGVRLDYIVITSRSLCKFFYYISVQ